MSRRSLARITLVAGLLMAFAIAPVGASAAPSALDQQRARLGLSRADIAGVVVTDRYSASSGSAGPLSARVREEPFAVWLTDNVAFGRFTPAALVLCGDG